MSIASLGRACMEHSLCSPCAPDRRVCAQHAGNASYSACAQRGVAFKPRKGDALLFYSLKPNGELDTLSLHGCACTHFCSPSHMMRRCSADSRPMASWTPCCCTVAFLAVLASSVLVQPCYCVLFLHAALHGAVDKKMVCHVR